jgi:hypothetical protein
MTIEIASYLIPKNKGVPLAGVAATAIRQDNSDGAIAKHHNLQSTLLGSNQPLWFVPEILTNPGTMPKQPIVSNTDNYSTQKFFDNLANFDQNAINMVVSLLPIIIFQANALKKMAETNQDLLKFLNQFSKAMADNATWIKNDNDEKYKKLEHKIEQKKKISGIVGILIGILEVGLAALAAVVSGGAAIPMIALALASTDAMVRIIGGSAVLNHSNNSKYTNMATLGMYYNLGANNGMIAQIIVDIVLLIGSMGTTLFSGITQAALGSMRTLIAATAQTAATAASEEAGIEMLEISANITRNTEAIATTTNEIVANETMKQAIRKIVMTAAIYVNLLTMISGMIATAAEAKKHKNNDKYAQMAASGIFALLLYTIYQTSGLEKKAKKGMGDIGEAIFAALFFSGSGIASGAGIGKATNELSESAMNLGSTINTKLMSHAREIMNTFQAYTTISHVASAAENLTSAVYNMQTTKIQGNIQLDQDVINQAQKIIEALQQETQGLSEQEGNDINKIVEISHKFALALLNAIEQYAQHQARS